MTDEIAKGATGPLQYSKQGRQRVTVGISWDTPEIMPERPEAFVSAMDEGTSDYDTNLDVTVGFVQEIYDLDLVCLIFDEEKDLIDAVSPSPQENVDLSGAIYHSGDDTAGVSAGDDEQISVELATLPDHIHHMVFLAIIQSGHTFGQVLNAECRVADGKTDSNSLLFSMGQNDREGNDCTACMMVSLHRGEEEGEWHIKHIAEYKVDKEIEDWGAVAQATLA